MGTNIHGNTSFEPCFYDERCDLGRKFCAILAYFMSEFSCHGNSLCSLAKFR